MTNVSPVFVFVLGIGTVFIGLYCLILLIRLMSKVLGGGKEVAAQLVPVAVPAKAPGPEVADRKAFDAAIAAAIATCMDSEPEGLRIRSIKKI